MAAAVARPSTIGRRRLYTPRGIQTFKHSNIQTTAAGRDRWAAKRAQVARARAAARSSWSASGHRRVLRAAASLDVERPRRRRRAITRLQKSIQRVRVMRMGPQMGHMTAAGASVMRGVTRSAKEARASSASRRAEQCICMMCWSSESAVGRKYPFRSGHRPIITPLFRILLFATISVRHSVAESR
jgi:hypothetical protein